MIYLEWEATILLCLFVIRTQKTMEKSKDCMTVEKNQPNALTTHRMVVNARINSGYLSNILHP